MGIDPPEEGETYDVTVELEGGVSKEVFDQYKKQLKECLEKLAQITDAKYGKKLKVRQIRAALTPKAARPSPPQA
jgi:hypothetical protein